MTAVDVMDRARAAGVELLVQGGHIVAAPPVPEDIRALVRQHKAALLAALTAKQPRISTQGELIIPLNAPYQYRWWSGGQSIADTLIELDVGAEVWGVTWTGPIPWRRAARWPRMSAR